MNIAKIMPNVSYSQTASHLQGRKINFKGVNDVDPTKTINKSHQFVYNTTSLYGTIYVTDIKEYNSKGQILTERFCVVNDSGEAPYYREYKYYNNGKLKSKLEKEYKEDHNYHYEEYREDGSLYKSLSNNQKYVDEMIYNEGGIAKKNVIKPGYIEDTACDTVELLYKKERSKTPYRILGKDYWGNLVKDIKDAGKLLKTTFERNKVLFKK